MTHSAPEQSTPNDTAKALIQAERYTDALGALDVQDPEQTVEERSEATYMRAVCYRKLNDHSHALQALTQLLEFNASYARAFQERGYNFEALKQPFYAIQAFQQAVALNPGLSASWRSLALLYKAEERMEEATFALRQFTFLSNLAPDLQAVTSLFYEKKYFKAEQICRHYMQRNPKDIEGMRLLAKLGVESKVMDDAEFLLESCVEFAPQHFDARVDYAVLLLRRQKFEKSLEQVQLLLPKKPDDMQLNILLADCLVGVGKPQEALTIYAAVLAQHPENHYARLTLGHAQKTLGDTDDAVSSYQSAYQYKPDFGDAYWSLANLKTYTFSEDELATMLEREATDGISLVDRIHFCFAIGKCYEDRKQFAESFEYYERGNRLKNQGTGYSSEVLDKRFHSHIEHCNSELFESKKGMGCDDSAPIFIVGMPRAGSTLLEQILASHSQVDGTMELPNILGMAYKLQGRSRLDEEQRYPAILHELNAEQLRGFGDKYIEETKVLRSGAPFFIDKMPNNFIHIGLIKTILPNAKIIDARRHPMGCCFSGFKQLFGEGQDFSYGLTEIGRYYRSYVELMDHWDRVLPNQVLLVQYEDVVGDLESQVQRILEFCDLPFEQGCLDYYKNDRDVRTPSAEQVRQPIYNSGLEQWRNFEPYLEPLKQALGEALLTRYPS